MNALTHIDFAQLYDGIGTKVESMLLEYVEQFVYLFGRVSGTHYEYIAWPPIGMFTIKANQSHVLKMVLGRCSFIILSEISEHFQRYCILIYKSKYTNNHSGLERCFVKNGISMMFVNIEIWL